VGLSIAALAAGSSLAGADVFEIEQPSLSAKLTKTQLAALLLPAPALFSGLPAVTVVNDTDLLEIEQGGVVSKLTKTQFLALFNPGAFTLNQTIIKQNGDVISYNGSSYVTGPTPRWRVIPQDAYSELSATTFNTITFAGGGPTGGVCLKATDHFSVGMPVRTVLAATQYVPANTYYGICTAVTDTLLTISGSSIKDITPAAITSLSVGSADMVRHVQLAFSTTAYNTVEGGAVGKGCVFRWKGSTGYCVCASAAHMGVGTGTLVRVYINNLTLPFQITPNVGTASTYGTWADTGAMSVPSSCLITNNQLLSVLTLSIGAANDYLIICMTFVVP